MTVEDIRAALPHLANIEPFGNPVRVFRVTTEEGYYLKKPTYDEMMYKTTGMIYPNEDLTTIQVVAEADLPEGAEICSGDNETETM